MKPEIKLEGRLNWTGTRARQIKLANPTGKSNWQIKLANRPARDRQSANHDKPRPLVKAGKPKLVLLWTFSDHIREYEFLSQNNGNRLSSRGRNCPGVSAWM